MNQANWHEFAAPPLLAAELASAVATRLGMAIDDHGNALLAVSGGSTPAKFFRTLAREPLDWAPVTVTLVDERFVPPSSERSNERLVTVNLLQSDAAAAGFLGLYHAGAIDQAAAVATADLAALGRPFDVVVLGMGTDGHTASFFDDAPNLGRLLDPEGEPAVLAVKSADAGEPRLTMSLSALASAGRIFLHIEGLPKKELLLDVLAGDVRPPVAAMIEHASSPIDIYWAPGETP
ncbi:MAG: 6-phosphogluconolactonase [Rhizobiaceae bacterium]